MNLDLTELLNCVQRHTKCTAGSSLRKDKSGQNKCRFSFPEPELQSSVLDCTDVNNINITTKRNDALLNKHNPYMIQTWRDNMDISPGLSKQKLINYLAKYISKSETKSKTMNEIMNAIMDTTEENKPAKSAIQKLFIRTCSERDYSAQETCHLLMGFKLYSSSRKFQTINFNKKECEQVIDPCKAPPKPFLEKYQERNQDMHNICMWQMARQNKANQPNIVMIFPNLRYIPGGDNEQYYRQQDLLYIPWRQEEEVVNITNDAGEACKKPWKEVYDQHINLIKENQENISQLTGQPDMEDDQIDDRIDSLTLEDWQALARMGPANLTLPFDLGLREIDLAKDWHSAAKKYDHLGGIPYLKSFIKNAKKETPAAQRSAIQDTNVIYSVEQQKVLNMVKDIISDMLTNTSTSRRHHS